MSPGDQKRVAAAKRAMTWGALLLGVLLLPVLLPLEESVGLWTLFEMRGALAPPAEVVVVGMDENSRAALNGSMARSMHAKVIDSLVRARAALIVFDVFLHEESEDDAELARAIHDAGDVILTAAIERSGESGVDVQTLRAPVPALSAPSLAVAPWMVPEAFRVNWTFLRDAAGRPTIPVVALQAHLFDEFIGVLRSVRPAAAARFPQSRGDISANRRLETIVPELQALFARDRALASDMLAASAPANRALRSLVELYSGNLTSETNRLYLNFYGPPRTITTIPYQDALAEGFKDDELAGKVVFVGYSARRQPGQRDDYRYVFSTDGFNLSGVEMAATAFSNLLHGEAVRPPSFLVSVIVVLIWGVFAAVWFHRLRSRARLIVGVVASVGYLAAAFFAFQRYTIWLPIVVPALQVLLAAFLAQRANRLIESAQLSVGTSEEAALALTGRGKPEKIDQRVVLFADERGSKKRLRREVEGLDVAKRRALQQDIAIARDVPIAANGGKINHTLADSMLASWIVPTRGGTADLAAPTNAACRAAISIHERLAALEREYQGYAPILRIGLDVGEITSRLNPSPEIKDWRMEGIPIHAAERLESLNKALGTSTLISDAVARTLDRKEFHTTELGTFIFCDDRGEVVVDALRVHELRRATGLSPAESGYCAGFNRSLAALQSGDWSGAQQQFAALAQGQHAALAARYCGWCEQTMQEPETRWRGVVMVTFSDKSQYLDRFL
jgi:adenylate cyclase